MGVCFFLLAALSFFRLWYIGTPNLDGLPINMAWEIVRRTLIFLLMSTIGISFLRLLKLDIDGSELTKLFLASIIIQIVAGLSLPLTTNDIFSNLAYGEMSQLGLDADNLGASALPATDPFRQLVTARWMNMPMVYGPIIGWFNYLATRPGDLWTSIIIYKLGSLFLSFLVTYLAMIFCRKNLNGSSACNSFILFGLNPVFIWEIASQAHNDVIMLVGVLGFLVLLTQNRPWAALIGLVFAAITKFAILPALAFYFCYTFFDSKKRFAYFLAFFIIGSLAFAYFFSEKLMMVLVAPSSSHGIDAVRITGTPLYLVYTILKSAGESVQTLGYKIYWMIAMIFMTIVGLRFAWRTRSREELFLHTILFILLFNLIASPMYQPWYALWILPFAMATTNTTLRNFIAIYSVISVTQYAILNSLSGAIINLGVLGYLSIILLSGKAYGLRVMSDE